MTRTSPFWLTTHSGKRVYPLELQAEDFCIEDIAQGLSNNCRYTGQCSSFYSVAEHSVRGSIRAYQAFGVIASFEFLLHDAAEAYVNDLVRPVCQVLKDYRDLRDKMQRFINVCFGLPEEMTSECREVDNRMLVTEAAVLFSHNDKWWEQPIYPKPYQDEWVELRDRPLIHDSRERPISPMRGQFWPPALARRYFLARYTMLKAEIDKLSQTQDRGATFG